MGIEDQPKRPSVVPPHGGDTEEQARQTAKAQELADKDQLPSQAANQEDDDDGASKR